MNEEIGPLIREIDQTRVAMREKKDVLKHEANPVHRLERSWSHHKGAWIGSGAAALALAVLLIWRKGHSKPVVPPGYVLVTRAAKSNPWVNLLKLAAVVAKPAITSWLKKRSLAGVRHNGRV